MLRIRLSINDNIAAIALITVVRRHEHPKLKRHFTYTYVAELDDSEVFEGTVLHNYDNGAIALLQKVTKAIVSQQKANKNDKA